MTFLHCTASHAGFRETRGQSANEKQNLTPFAQQKAKPERILRRRAKAFLLKVRARRSMRRVSLTLAAKDANGTQRATLRS